MTFGAGFGFPRARFPMGAAPTLNMDFAGTAALPPYVTFSRGTNATYVDSLGNIAYAPSNLLTYSEQFDNAVWFKTNATITANTTVAPDGTTTGDTFTAAANSSQIQATYTGIAGIVYTASMWIKRRTGTGLVYFRSVENVNTPIAVTDNWQRFDLTVTSTTTTIRCGVFLQTSGDEVDVWGAQLNLGTLQPYNSTTVKNLLGYTQDFDNAAWTKSNSFIQTNLLTYSEQFDNAAWSKFGIAVQTNQLRNNTMQGAVVGTPGTAPTNTSIVTGGGISSQIVSVGAEDGVNYYDVRFFGTGSSVTAERVYLEFGATVAASTGQTWSLSAYLKLVSGVVPAGLFIGVDETGPGTTYIKTDQNNLSITSTLLRYNYSWALSGGANVAFILPQIGFNSAIGVAVDFTIRIGLPQLVLGAASGDVVRTYGTAMPVMYQSPVNTLAADKIIETFTNGQHLVQTITPASAVVGISYTLSAYAKAGERSELAFTSFGEPTAVFDLLTGTVSVTGGLVCSITDAGGGWYRCSATFVKANINGWYYIGLWQSGSYTYPGNGVSGLYLWGAQVVQGATPGDYQVTTTAALPVQYRAPDGSLTADKLVEASATGVHEVASGTPSLGVLYTASVFAKAAERTRLLIQGLGLGGQGFTCVFDLSAVTVTNAPVGSSIVPVGGGWFRCSVVVTCTATVTMLIRTTDDTNNSTYTGDGTSGIYIWGAQLSDSASLDPYSYNFTTAPTAAVYYGPRFDYDPVTLACKGLLIEEQRTNSIRNNTMQGAVAGSPGTVPTNWVVSGTGSGVTREIVAIGSESGIQYIDVRFYGTPTVTSNVSVNFELPNGIAAASGQTWTGSTYIRLANGLLSGAACTLSLLETNGTSGVVDNSKIISPVAGGLSASRDLYTATLSGGVATTNIQPRIRIGFVINVPLDITLRIGLPQLELGAFATSVIPTTTTAVTRAADVAVIQGANFSNWYNQSEGTLYAEFDVVGYALSGAFPTTTAFSDGTNNNRMLLANANTGGNLYPFYEISTGGVTQVGLYGATGASFGAGTPRKVTGTYMDNNFAFTTQGVSVQTDSLGTVPPANRLNLGVNAVGNGNYLNGHIARIAYYPTRQPDPTLQAITTT